MKISTGEGSNHNYLKPELIKGLVQLVKGTIVECNTAYGSGLVSRALTSNMEYTPLSMPRK